MPKDRRKDTRQQQFSSRSSALSGKVNRKKSKGRAEIRGQPRAINYKWFSASNGTTLDYLPTVKELLDSIASDLAPRFIDLTTDLVPRSIDLTAGIQSCRCGKAQCDGPNRRLGGTVSFTILLVYSLSNFSSIFVPSVLKTAQTR